MPRYNKLVRDRIPEVIKISGKSFRTRILNDKEYKEELKIKLHEELEEYLGSQSGKEAVEELADILEVVYALAKEHGSSIDQLQKIRRHKAERRGKFENRVFLIDVED